MRLAVRLERCSTALAPSPNGAPLRQVHSRSTFLACGAGLPLLTNENALAGRAPPEKASGCLVRRRLCRWWAMDYAYPGFMLPPHLSIRQNWRGVGVMGRPNR